MTQCIDVKRSETYFGCCMQVTGYVSHLNCLVHGSAMQWDIDIQISFFLKLKSRAYYQIYHFTSIIGHIMVYKIK